jgi:hypothetical protein
MKRCPRCNLNFPDSLTFCESCGGGLGEVVSLRCPACGETAQPGWKFCVKCQAQLPSPDTRDLSNPTERSAPLPTAPLVSESSAPLPTLPLVPPQTSSTAPLREEDPTRSSQATISDMHIRVRCRSCRSLVDEDSVFCEFCGTNMFEDTAPLIAPPQPAPMTQRFTNQQTYCSDTLYEPARAEEATVVSPKPYAAGSASSPQEITAERTAPSLSMLESYGHNAPPRQSKWWHGLLVAVFVLMVIGAFGAGGWYWWSHRSSAAEVEGQPTPGPAPTAIPTTPRQTTNVNSADDELKKLRTSRVSASPSDADKIVGALADAEKKYPTDYRFPYERAKLSIKGMISHHEAFEAIFLAGAKAIDNGKAQEMLNDLMSDKDGDFYKMSRGHHEWATLEAALRNKDKSGLVTHHE